MNYPTLIEGYAKRVAGISGGVPWDYLKAYNYQDQDDTETVAATITGDTEKQLAGNFTFLSNKVEILGYGNPGLTYVHNGVPTAQLWYDIIFHIFFRAP